MGRNTTNIPRHLVSAAMALRYLLVLVLSFQAVAYSAPQQVAGVHLPLVRKQVYRRERVLSRRGGETAKIGIGDYLDV